MTPKGRRYRYIYKVTHSHKGKQAMHEDHLDVGTKFMMHTESGKEVHGHIKSVDGDKVTYVIDDGADKGKEVTGTKAEILAMLNEKHGVEEKLQEKRDQLKADIEQARKTGTEKQVARLEAQLKRLGGEPAKQSDSEFMSAEEIAKLSADEIQERLDQSETKNKQTYDEVYKIKADAYKQARQAHPTFAEIKRKRDKAHEEMEGAHDDWRDGKITADEFDVFAERYDQLSDQYFELDAQFKDVAKQAQLEAEKRFKVKESFQEFQDLRDARNKIRDTKKQEESNRFKEAKKKQAKQKPAKKKPAKQKPTEQTKPKRSEVSSANADKIASFRENADRLNTLYRDNYYTSGINNKIAPNLIEAIHNQLDDNELDIALTPLIKEEIEVPTKDGTTKVQFESLPQLEFDDFKIGYQTGFGDNRIVMLGTKGESKGKVAKFLWANSRRDELARLRVLASVVEGRNVSLKNKDQIKSFHKEIDDLLRSQEFNLKATRMLDVKKVMGATSALSKLESPITVSEKATSQNADMTQQTHAKHDSLSKYAKSTQKALKQSISKDETRPQLHGVNVEDGMLWTSNGASLTYTQTTHDKNGLLQGDKVDTENRAPLIGRPIVQSYSRNVKTRIDLDKTEAKKLSTQIKQLKKLNHIPEITLETVTRSTSKLGESAGYVEINDSRGIKLASIETDAVSESGSVGLKFESLEAFTSALDSNQPVSIGTYHGGKNSALGIQVFTPTFNRIIQGMRV